MDGIGLKIGQEIDIHQEPLTRTRLEGKAIVKKIHSVAFEAGLIYSLDVKFVEDTDTRQKYPRVYFQPLPQAKPEVVQVSPQKYRKECPVCKGTGNDVKHQWPGGQYAACEMCEGYGDINPPAPFKSNSALVEAAKNAVELNAPIENHEALESEAAGIPRDTVTINQELRLFVIPCEDGFTCLGFDVCENWRKGLAKWLGAVPVTLEAGTIESYNEYKRLSELGAAHYNATGKRCDMHLEPQLIGLEGKRVEVEDRDGTKRRFKVGKSTSWCPCHLELTGPDYSGGPSTCGPYKSVRVIR